MPELNLRFPSGKSISQVKKDAKRLSKKHKIKLSTALDLEATRNGLKMPWIHIYRYLTKTNQTLFSKKIDSFNFELTTDRPIGLIVGSPGTGKTWLALSFCEQHLKRGKSVHWFTYGRSESDSYIHDGLVQRLDSQYDQFVGHAIHEPLTQTNFNFKDFKVPNESLLIVDELALLRAGPKDIRTLASQTKSGLIVILQGISNLDWCGFKASDANSFSWILAGHGSLGLYHNRSSMSPIDRLAVEIVEKTKVLAGGKSEFLILESLLHPKKLITTDPEKQEPQFLVQDIE